jgi:hypothetical protein
MAISAEEYAEYHESREELRETLADHYPTKCPVGLIEDCNYFHVESDDECWCEHPRCDDMFEDGCPLDEEEVD